MELFDNNSADSLRASWWNVISVFLFQWRKRSRAEGQSCINKKNHFPCVWFQIYAITSWPQFISDELWVINEHTGAYVVRANLYYQCARMTSQPLHLLQSWPGFRCQALAWSGPVKRCTIHPKKRVFDSISPPLGWMIDAPLSVNRWVEAANNGNGFVGMCTVKMNTGNFSIESFVSPHVHMKFHKPWCVFASR